ncbi:MAG TPA: lipocalin family protein [Phenylobacterium sp.]|jgi:apolipoprotein D and lipocalin family protein|uniref:Outer membrane lipoprotein Blc n=1 Tax=Phenylobacterium conjunctum TaxID=1298959 RepID=A0ABW3T2N4_9CAUL|nr:lipocalin family protein [Phenylobacterium sp.]HQP19358.1 lipocalin family protein [Phenylobacterium sp.]
MRQLLLPLLIATAGLSACAAMPVGNPKVPEPAQRVELDRYLGTWREFARYENRFERDCVNVTATYGQRPDGKLSVLNACERGGKSTVAKGVARLTGDDKGAKLEVSFFGPFYADYWVLDRAPDYSWSIVGEPSGRYLWILTRQARPDAQTREDLVARVKALGYDTSLLHFTAQP